MRVSRGSDKTSDTGSQYRCGRVGRGIQPPSTPQVPHSHTQNASKTLIFELFDSCSQTDGRTDGPTDKASYRVACPQLKTGKRLPKSLKIDRHFRMSESKYQTGRNT